MAVPGLPVSPHIPEVRMATFQMADGAIVNTAQAKCCWAELTRWNGNNHISVNTGSQWAHETLYLSRKGRYYLVGHSQWQGSLPSAEFISDEQAARWLLRNNEELPEALAAYEDSVTE
jgi:hypothetical protein